jgi:hypothetical protein
VRTPDSNLFFLAIATLVLAVVGIFLAVWINKRELKTSFFLGLEFWQTAALGLAVIYQIYFSLGLSDFWRDLGLFVWTVPRISLSSTTAWVLVGFSIANLMLKELRLVLGSLLFAGIILAGFKDLTTPSLSFEVFLFYSTFVFIGVYSIFCALPKGLAETAFGYVMCAFSVFFLLDASHMTRKFQFFLGVRASSDILVFLSLLVVLGWVAYILKIFKNSMIVILFVPTLFLATSYSLGPVALICILGLFLSAFLGHVNRQVR